VELSGFELLTSSMRWSGTALIAYQEQRSFPCRHGVFAVLVVAGLARFKAVITRGSLPKSSHAGRRSCGLPANASYRIQLGRELSRRWNHDVGLMPFTVGAMPPIRIGLPQTLRRCGRRCVSLAIVGVIMVASTGVWLVSRRGADSSAIDFLPSDAAARTAWPGSTIRPRSSDPVHRMYERESSTLDIKLADGGYLGIQALDYSNRSGAWFASKVFSPGWNGYYWAKFPQRREPEGEQTRSLPNGSVLVGFECPPSPGDQLECNRWILWWKRGHGIWVAHWAPIKLATTSAAIEILSPLWDS